MPLQANIALAGAGGLAGVILVVGYLIYDKNPDLGTILILVGLITAVIVIASELYIRYMDADSRRKESEAKAQWAPFTY